MPIHILLTLLLGYSAIPEMDLRAHPALTEPASELTIAQEWLTQVDAHLYAASWSSASKQFRTIITQTQWEHALTAYRKPIGALVSRTQPSIHYTTTLPGHPSGSYAGITFHSSFSRKATTRETVVLIQDTDGRWRVIGYTIK